MTNIQKLPPLVSVVIPSYNHARFLERAVESIIIQQIDSLEIIIADDGSTDNTEEVVARLKEKHPCIVYVKNHTNMGESASRNLAIKTAIGEYIAFLDSDDEWLPGKLEKQLEFLKQESSGYHAVATNYFLVDTNGDKIKIESWFPKFNLTALNLLKKGCNVGSGSTMLIKRDVFEKIGYFDESLPIFVDVDWLCRFCEFGFKMWKIKEYLVLYNKSPMRPGCFLEEGVRAFKNKNRVLLKKFSLFDRILIESQFYNYISHSYLVNGPFINFFYTRFLHLLLNPFVNLGNHKHLFIETFRHLLRKIK